jgi:non-ribosomal peptide synthetase-like protein
LISSVEITQSDRTRTTDRRNTTHSDTAVIRNVTRIPALVDRVSDQRLLQRYRNCGNLVRWREGERLNHLIERCCEQFADNQAVVTDEAILSYRELDARANQLARFLLRQGIKSGDRVGLLFDKGCETYVALLAVMKVHAAYVPLDPAFPGERIQFIAADAGLSAVVSMSSFHEKLELLTTQLVLIDRVRSQIEGESARRLTDSEVAAPHDQVCYIIYTSGTTGNPKGVIIEHPSICNFVRVAADLYGFAPGDRVYQGMTIAFDFSVEEIWVPLMVGATLVPGRPGASLVGTDLAVFLRDRRVTCLCCCPTMLATIDEELPQLRILLVGGEACPQHLVRRWHRPGRAILNSYGPTEATVTASLIELAPNRPVTIGRPLPTYSIIILDPDEDLTMAPGELGEIGIAGIGLAAGYMNRAELTAQKFIPDFLGIANNPSKRIYRTGDLGRINADDEIEYHGRIDTQVKIRGHRIETGEIESVLLEIPEISQATVATYEPEPGMVELIAYYSFKRGCSLSRSDITQALRRRLPATMVPAFLEELPLIPMLISGKADRKRLPKPKGPRYQAENKLVQPATRTERVLARILAEVLQVDCVSVEDHFFNDLGAHSLLMARFCARLRRDAAISKVSMRDIYQNSTIAKLAMALDSNRDEPPYVANHEPFHVPSDLSYYGCGGLQLLFYVGYGWLTLWIAATGLSWIYAASGSPLDLYVRSVTVAVVTFAGLTALPVAAKWLLLGRCTRERIPIWSLRYFRFWLVKWLMRSAPVAVFVGSPLYNLYLRALGAKIGHGAVILSRFVPVATDLFSVGANTILRKDSILLGYRARANFIEIGSIDIGRDAFVGEASVLDIDTAVGDRAQLGHASSLQSGQRVPDGSHYHGSPAVETRSEYCPIESRECSSLRRGLYVALQLVGLLTLIVPALTMMLNGWYVYFTGFAGEPMRHFDGPTWLLVSFMLRWSAGVLVGSILLGVLVVYAVPRIANAFLRPDRTYPLYGLHYWLQTVVSRMSNSRFFNLLFGDSSFIVTYMRLVGWNLNEVEQTGSNFGTNQRHDNPFLCELGSATMVSDGLSMINMHMSGSSFRLCPARIGNRNYLGNDIHYPPDGRTGANCLLGTKVMIPIDGPVRENVGLLGSPCFEIPRIVERDKQINAALGGEIRQQRIRRKNAHNFVTASLFLLSRWLFLFVTLLVSHVAILNYEAYGISALLIAEACLSVAAVAFFATIERASLAFRRLSPKMASIYEHYFWAHERHWKLSDTPIMELFGGTPFKNLISRLVGVKIGRKVFDGGCSITDRTLTEIGDCVNLNEGSVLQAHSLEEGVFKSDYVRVGAGSTVGPGAFVHYGVTLGDRVAVDADTFVMKGEVLEANTIWRGNPAKLIRIKRRQEQSLGCVEMRKTAGSNDLQLSVARIATK